MAETHDLIVIGAGSAGLAAAEFAARLGARVALVEAHRIGGDCTWTGCVPSKALLKAAKIAHGVRTAAAYGVAAGPGRVDMAAVRAYVRGVVERVYHHETPEALRAKGIEVVLGRPRFVDAHALEVGGRRLRARRFVVATGARPVIPAIPGLREVPFHTYESIFDQDRLPERLTVLGAGPIGMEMAQAHARLGARVTLVDERMLPREEPEVAEVMGRVFAREGIRFVAGLASRVRLEGGATMVTVEAEDVAGDELLVAVGRAPNVEGLGLAEIGVRLDPRGGIVVDRRLRTTVRHIYAAGDCIGGPQFTHVAGWQAFHAVRNALLPFGGTGVADVVPWTTFTDPEVAHVGLTEAQARGRFGSDVYVTQRLASRIDRAMCENDTDGFVKLVHRANGTLLGATIVAQRAGEALTEVSVALDRRLAPRTLATTIHVYPTYSDAVQQTLGDVAWKSAMRGWGGALLRAALKLRR